MKMENKKYLGKNLDGSTMFANIAVSKHARRGERARQILTGIFYALLIYGFVTPCGALMRPQPLLGVGQRDVQNRFLFSAHETDSFEMSKLEEKNLQGVKYSNPSATTVVRNTAISSKSLQRQLTKLQKEIASLHEAYEQARKEKFYYLFYISKLCSWYLPYYQQKNSIDSQDWEKLYKQSVEQSNIL